MVSAFTEPWLLNGADFGEMTESEKLEDQLSIGLIMQAFVEVNEEGTEVAAATSVALDILLSIDPRAMVPFVPVFRADKPFFYMIRDMRTGCALFMERILKP